MYIFHHLLVSALLVELGFVPLSHCILALMAQKPPVENLNTDSYVFTATSHSYISIILVCTILLL